MQSRILTLLAAGTAVGAVATLSSCGDPTAIPAQFENVVTQGVVFALNGTPTALPSGLHLRSRLPVRVDANFFFDLAFDINDSNEVVVYTQRALANELEPTHPVGLQLIDEPFDAIIRAPVQNYKYDSSLVFPGNQVLLVDVIDPTCASILGLNIRAKIRMDSVSLTERSVFLTYLVNQNCGFRGLATGRPPD